MSLLPLVLIGAALIVGFGAIAFLICRRLPVPPPAAVAPAAMTTFTRPCFLFWPVRWLLVRSDNLASVQAALGLHHPEPCSWFEGLSHEEKLFIGGPIEGWVLAAGAGLPDPAQDVDACFRFILGLSRRLGEVQYFSINRVLQYHGWVKAKHGRIVRAYAWAGATLWNQGRKTREEQELDLKCYGYGEECPEPVLYGHSQMEANVEKVPLLAARWSLNLAYIYEHLQEQERGFLGDP